MNEKDRKIKYLQDLLAEKDEELAELKDRLEYITGNRSGVVQVFDITDHDKEIRHQVCEEIREKLKREYTREENKYWLSMEKVCFVNGYDIFDEFEWEKILDQIEQGENK